MSPPFFGRHGRPARPPSKRDEAERLAAEEKTSPSGENPRAERKADPRLAPTPGPVLAGDEFDSSGSAASVRATVGRAALIILLATVVGRLLGLGRDMLVAYFFGMSGLTDAFFLAYKIPFLLSLTVGGALTATFIPVFTHHLVTGRRREAWTLSVNMMNAIGLVLVGVSLVLIAAAPLVIPLVGFGFPEETAERAVFLFRLLIPTMIFTSLSGLAIGILHSLKRFGVAAFSTSAGAAVTIIFVVIFERSLGITSLAIGTSVGALASFTVLLPQLHKYGLRYTPRIDWRSPGLWEVAMLIWPIFIGSGVGQISIFVDQTLASTLSEGSVSALNYAEKLFQLPLGLFVAGITVPIFPLLSEQVAANQPDRLKATLNLGLRLIAFVMLPAGVGLIALRSPIIALLFQRGEFSAEDTERTAQALLFFSLGLFSFAGRDTLNRVFYAYHDTRTPVKISVLSVFLNIAASATLMQFLGVGGLALGTTIALSVNLVVLMELLRRKLGPMGFGQFARSFLRIAGASAVMGVAVWSLDRYLRGLLSTDTLDLLLRVGAGVALGALVFLGVAASARLAELREVVDMLRSVLTRRSNAGEDNGNGGRT